MDSPSAKQRFLVDLATHPGQLRPLPGCLANLVNMEI